jgi:hypothetical protein
MNKVLDSVTLPGHECATLEKWASNQTGHERSWPGLHPAMRSRQFGRQQEGPAGWTKTASNAMVGHGVFSGNFVDSGSRGHYGLFVFADRRHERASR